MKFDPNPTRMMTERELMQAKMVSIIIQFEAESKGSFDPKAMNTATNKLLDLHYETINPHYHHDQDECEIHGIVCNDCDGSHAGCADNYCRSCNQFYGKAYLTLGLCNQCIHG